MTLKMLIASMQALPYEDLSRLVAATNAELRRRHAAAHVSTHQDGECPLKRCSGHNIVADSHGNKTAVEGCDRCECGCKYWENDRCVDCGTTHAPRHAVNE